MFKPKLDSIAIIFLVLCCLFFVSPLFFPHLKLIVTPDFGTSDSFNSSISPHYLLWQAIQSHSIPYWTDLMNGGYPFVGSLLASPFFIPNILLYTFFDFPVAYNLLIFGCLVLFSLGFYSVSRSFRIQPIIAIFFATAATFSGMIILQLVHFTLVETLSLLPFVLYISKKCLEKPSLLSITTFLLVTSQQILAGFPQAVVVTWCVVPFIIMFTTSSWKKFISSLFFLIFLMGISIIMSLCLLVPAADYARQTGQEMLDPQTNTYYSFPYLHIITFLVPFSRGNPKYGTFPSIAISNGNVFWENTAFFGILPFLLAVWAISKKSVRETINKRQLIITLTMVTVGFLMMTGKYSPFYFVHTFWPLNAFRVPSRNVWIFVIGTLLFFQFWVNHLWSQKKSKSLLVVVSVLTIFNISHLFISWWENYHFLGDAQSFLKSPPVTQYLNKDDKIFTVGNELMYTNIYDRYHQTSLIPYLEWNNTLAPNSNILYGIASQNVSAGRYLYRAFLSDVLLSNQIANDKSSFSREASVSASLINQLHLMGITKLITPYTLTEWQGNTAASVDLSFLKMPIHVYPISNNTVGYTANSLITINSVTDITSYYKKNSQFNNSLAFIEADASPSAALSTQIDVDTIENTPVQKRFRVNNRETSEGFFVFNSYYYPGWVATINDKKVDIIPTNLRQKGLYIPPGESMITFQYRPSWLYPSLLISLVSYGIVGGLFIYNFSKRFLFHR